jgi:hypothetical protein
VVGAELAPTGVSGLLNRINIGWDVCWYGTFEGEMCSTGAALTVVLGLPFQIGTIPIGLNY